MRQKFTITESDRKHIKKLYEQEEPNNNNESGGMELEIGSLVFATISEYSVKVGIKDDHDNDSVGVIIKMDGEEVVSVELDYNYDDGVVSDEQAVNFVTQKAKEGFFDNLPTYMAYDIEKNEPFDFD